MEITIDHEAGTVAVSAVGKRRPYRAFCVPEDCTDDEIVSGSRYVFDWDKGAVWSKERAFDIAADHWCQLPFIPTAAPFLVATNAGNLECPSEELGQAVLAGIKQLKARREMPLPGEPLDPDVVRELTREVRQEEGVPGDKPVMFIGVHKVRRAGATRAELKAYIRQQLLPDNPLFPVIDQSQFAREIDVRRN